MTKLKINRIQLLDKLNAKLTKEKELRDNGTTSRDLYERVIRRRILSEINLRIAENPSDVKVVIPSGRYTYSDSAKKDALKIEKHLKNDKILVKFEKYIDLDFAEFVPTAKVANEGLIARLESAIERLEMAQNEIIEVSERDDYFSLM